MTVILPGPVSEILEKLESAGYEAYAVGGCVRDSVLGVEPNDWDITTSALPVQTERVFAGEKIAETGLEHGTVTLIKDHTPYEITTYRVDGKYTDSRHPDWVAYTLDLTEDLARRDFTINAMAWNDRTGLVDIFGGESDIKKQVIRCVGQPELRFGEDALRILRAIRFASTLGFLLESCTSDAAHRGKDRLKAVSKERISEELMKLICGKNAEDILSSYRDILEVIIPELSNDQDFDFTAHAVGCGITEPSVRLALLLQNSGDASSAANITSRLRLPKSMQNTVTKLVKYKDLPLSTDSKDLCKNLKLIGKEDLKLLVYVRKASGFDAADDVMNSLNELLLQDPVYKISNLAVSGTDLINAGVVPGPELGKLLEQLLGLVMDGRVSNEREPLLRKTEELING